MTTQDFAASQPVADVLSEASQQAQNMVSWNQAAAHFRESLNSLDDNSIDLRGTWVASATQMSKFGEAPDPSCESVGPETWVIGTETVFLYGKELKSSDGTCKGVEYADQDNSDWEGVAEASRDGNEGVVWFMDKLQLLDIQCGPVCELGELRTTINDWDEKCLSDNFDYNKSTIDSDDKAYCRESDSHNGPVVEYSEVTYVDRLGGDRILRLKRDYNTGQVPDQDADRAQESSFEEIGFQFSVMNRQEALDHTVDLTEGEWEEKVISDTDTQTVDGNTYDFANNPTIALDCADGFGSCTWSELNDTHSGVQYIHVRGTDVINWVDGDTVGTLKRVTDG